MPRPGDTRFGDPGIDSPVLDAPIAAPPSSDYLREELGGRLFDEVRRRPARSLLVAAGTGFLAGGGLGTSFTARVLGSTARLALRLAIVPLFVDAFERALSTRAAGTIFLPPSNTNNVPKEMHS